MSPRVSPGSLVLALAALVLGLAGAGCVYVTGDFACQDDSHCPSWLQCSEGLCREPGGTGEPAACEGEELRAGSVSLRTAADVEELAAGGTTCLRLDGSLTIELSDLEDLVGLERLVEITGSLLINDNGRLQRLDGLSGLVSIGGELEVRGNGVLSDVGGLSSLKEVGSDVEIRDNPSLSQSAALALVSQLTSLGGEARVRDNGDR